MWLPMLVFEIVVALWFIIKDVAPHLSAVVIDKTLPVTV